MRVVFSVIWSILVFGVAGCGNDNPNEPSDALVLYFNQISTLDVQETRLFDAIGFARTTAIAGTVSQGLAAYNDIRIQISDFQQVIVTILPSTEVSATHQKWVRVWQLRMEHVDLSIQAINEGVDPDLILQSDTKLNESNILRTQVGQEWDQIFTA